MFLEIADSFTKKVLKNNLSNKTRKAITDTLTLNYKKGQHEVYKEKIGSAILSVQRSILPYANGVKKALRRIHLIIYADEYWADDANVIRAWKDK